MDKKNIGLAFSSLKARSQETSGGGRDRVFLTDYILETEIGAFTEERGKMQRLRFNVVVEVKPHGELNDDVDKILSYDTIISAIKHTIAAGRINLLETFAENIASYMLAFAPAHRIFIRIEKLDRGPYNLGVEIVRTQAPKLVQQNSASPQIIFLGADFLKGRRKALGALVGGIHRPDCGMILCLSPKAHPPRDGHGKNFHHLRIDLLALEQEIWKLALEYPRFDVVHSQTELSAKMEKNEVVLWAPSKMVIDTPELCGGAFSPLNYALWLAKKMGSHELLAFAPRQAVRHSVRILWRDDTSGDDTSGKEG